VVERTAHVDGDSQATLKTHTGTHKRKGTGGRGAGVRGIPTTVVIAVVVAVASVATTSTTVPVAAATTARLPAGVARLDRLAPEALVTASKVVDLALGAQPVARLARPSVVWPLALVAGHLHLKGLALEAAAVKSLDCVLGVTLVFELEEREPRGLSRHPALEKGGEAGGGGGEQACCKSTTSQNSPWWVGMKSGSG
jgi:hypothetical protein